MTPQGCYVRNCSSNNTSEPAMIDSGLVIIVRVAGTFLTLFFVIFTEY